MQDMSCYSRSKGGGGGGGRGKGTEGKIRYELNEMKSSRINL